jgi:hypothetical protein
MEANFTIAIVTSPDFEGYFISASLALAIRA